MLTRRRLLVAGLLLLAGTYLLAGGLGLPTVNPTDGNTPSQDRLIQPVENGSYLWPYTSRAKTTRERTLATNIIIVGDDDRVKRTLTQETALDWQITEPENESTANGTDVSAANETLENASVDAPTPENSTNATDAPNATNATNPKPVTIQGGGLGWQDTHGAKRYSYIDARPAGGDAGWVREAYQIHAGDYFGSRYHIRAYTTQETEWTAVQIHREYFDWFRLRHTVVGIQPSRNALESDFLDKPFVQSVSREYYGVNRGWNDGWISKITLLPGTAVLLVLGLFTRATRYSLQQEARRLVRWGWTNVRGFILAGALVALYLSVRTAGVVFESTLSGVDPKVVFPILYPALAVGLPTLTFVLSQPFGATSRFARLQQVARRLGPSLDTMPAFGFAFVGLTAAFVLDFGGLGISSIPVQLVLHRVGLACGLGLIAAGSSHIDERGAGLLVLGSLGWVTGLLMPLTGFV
ncbi:hypothetical protein [Salinibaculum salinum]|uniref:hypothetical protein n=1 Tax=Salinibaculum salinum TaxID=3131996 RepID=UPI0030EF7775